MTDQKVAEAVIQKAIDILVNTAANEWNYIFKLSENVGRIKDKAKQLEGVEVDVEQDVEAAKWGGERTGGDIDRWKADVDEIKSKSKKLVEDAEKVKNGLWNKRLNVFRRSSLSRKAENLDPTLDKLIADGQKHVKVNHGKIPAGMLGAVSALNHNELKSRKLLLDDVMEALEKDENYMIGIWGMVGVGKTTLADEVKRRVIEGHLFGTAIKVLVSKDLHIPEIQDVIATNLGLPTLTERDEDGKARRLHSRLTDGSKNLVILDNVWDEVPLHRIGLPLHGMQKGCKILVTSRNHLVLMSMGIKCNFKVKPLLQPEAQQLFKKIASDIPKGDILEKLTEECAGLPLAITTVARRLVDRNPQVWDNALADLKALTSRKEFTKEDHAYAPIEVSYNLLNDNSDAQRLLLLCCLFPEEANIPIQKLIRYVKGVQLLNVSDSLMDTSSYVFTLIDVLMNYSLLLRDDTAVMINHVVRAVCLSISSKEEKKRLNVKHRPKLMKWPYDKEEQQPYTGISLTFDDQMQELQFPDGLAYPDLELLQLQFHSDSLKLSDNNFTFKGMTEVRVLDFKRMTQWGNFIQIDALLPVLHILTKLRTLCIEFCNLNNKDLSLVESLEHLEVLSFFCSQNVNLPTQIKHLTNLKLLDLRCAGPLVIPSQVISALKTLEELYLGNYDEWLSSKMSQGGEASGIRITELSELPLLRVLQVRVNEPALLLELDEKAWFEKLTKFQIVAMQDIQTFLEYEIGKSITLHEMDWKLLLKAKIHKLLKITECLKLVSTTFRNLFVEFSGLKSLELQRCNGQFIMDTEDSAETLNNLNHLIIANMRKLVALCEKELPSKSLVKLETIKLERLNALQYLWKAPAGSGCLGNLRFLDMSYCKAITFIFPFSVAKGLVRLEKLDIRNCENLKWIVSKGEDEETNNEIVLKKLSYLVLDKLLKFCSFSDSVVKNSEKVTSEKTAKHDEKSGCSWLALKRLQASHSGEPSASKDVSAPTSNVETHQVPQVLEHNVEINNPLFNQLVELPSMKKLLIGSISNLRHVVDDQTSRNTVSEIKIMVVTDCKNLLDLAASEDSIRSLQNLEQVKVERCESMKALFNFGDAKPSKKAVSVLSSTKSISIPPGTKAVSVLPGTKAVSALPGTEAVSVLSKLATITLLKVNELNEVLLKVPENTPCFKNLKSLEISDCRSLKYIFSVSVAKMLGKLEDLKVIDCAKVEEIIDIHGGNKEEKPDPINFSCLRVLHLESLASISSFSSGNYEFNFPKLKDMLVRECPIMDRFCHGQVRARLLYEVMVGDHQEAQDVPHEYALNQTLKKLHQMMTVHKHPTG